ncbi:Carotenoid 9,10(9',10')-cleavage dioxygenase 1 [Capsicum annuum]|nr:Carotenoid 9,10(9',10')-cleavage dioxygenase 1 [Capsicum annuum]
MGEKKEEEVAMEISEKEGDWVMVKPKPNKKFGGKAIDFLEKMIVKLMYKKNIGPSHFLSGNFAPVDETPPCKDLPVKGYLPRERKRGREKMGRKEENGVGRIEGGVVVVDPKPQNGVFAKAIDWLEWGIIKLMNDSTKPIQYLQGNYAPTDETPPVNDLPVKGHLPECLNGEFVRVGPNPKFAPVAGYHWFDGDGMIHGLHIKDGKATYVSRFVRTSRLKQEEFFGGAKFMKKQQSETVQPSVTKATI